MMKKNKEIDKRFERYVIDRDRLFAKHGNGWWYTAGVNTYDYKSKYREKLERIKNNAEQKQS